MQFDEGKLKAYLDGALSPAEAARVEEQLAQSAEAREALGRLRRQAEVVSRRLDALAPADRPLAAQALQRLQRHAAASSSAQIQERMVQMFNNSFVRQYRSALIAVAAALVLAFLFSFAPVRSAAGRFLKIFRVQEVKIVPVDVAQMEKLKNNPEFSGLMQQFNPNVERVAGGGEPQPVASLEEAAAAVDFAPLPLKPFDGGGTVRIALEPAATDRVNLDKDLLEAIFQSAGIQIQLPDSLNESPIILHRPTAILQTWEEDERPALHFVQLRSPEIEYPDDLDLQALGTAGLQLLGMPEPEARALSATIDWANTLVLPIPADSGLTVTEVTVNGAKGFLFTDEAASGDGTALMWQQNGVTYLLQGRYGGPQLLAIAERMSR